jgi:hypothetical protein
MNRMLNLLLGCLALVLAYRALINWSRHKVSTAARSAERLHDRESRVVAFGQPGARKSRAADEVHSALYH